jgi:serine/threonine-protein kinase
MMRQLSVAVGDMVGRYRLLERIGAGSMGEVYLAMDESLDRQAAVKLLGRTHLANPVLRTRFVTEARSLAHLSHPNLITIYEAGTAGDDERPYFAMELLEGGTTHDLLHKSGSALGSAVVAAIAVQAAVGLREVALAGIVHRDVKPSNLGISAQGVVKVMDFGVVKTISGGPNLTADGVTVGTAEYIAPEQARGEPLDERADVYALGCTLFELLCGRAPFAPVGPEVTMSLIDKMCAHVFAPIPDPRAVQPGCDDELAAVLVDCLQKQRQQRPSFAALVPRLSKIHARLGGQLRPARP